MSSRSILFRLRKHDRLVRNNVGRVGEGQGLRLANPPGGQDRGPLTCVDLVGR